MTQYLERLIVIWRAPHAKGGTRHVVGDLFREQGGYKFEYRPGLDAAERGGFTEIPEFPRRAKPYRSGGYLFPTFAQRIPAPTRPDSQAMLAEWGVTHPDDPLEILARSGGLQATDRLELAEYRPDDDDLTVPLSFRVAGQRLYDDPDATRVEVGTPVELQREPHNPHDANACLVVSIGGVRLGHVPRQYSTLFARLIDAGVSLETTTERRLLVPGEGKRWVIRARRSHPLP